MEWDSILGQSKISPAIGAVARFITLWEGCLSTTSNVTGDIHVYNNNVGYLKYYYSVYSHSWHTLLMLWGVMDIYVLV